MLSYISATDGLLGVPLTPVFLFGPNGEEIDLTDPTADPTIDLFTIEEGATATYTWIANAFDANSDPEVDDSRELEAEILLLGGIGGESIRSLGTAEFSVIDRPLLEWGIRPLDGRINYFSGQVARVEGLIRNISTQDDRPPCLLYTSPSPRDRG